MFVGIGKSQEANLVFSWKLSKGKWEVTQEVFYKELSALSCYRP